MNGNDMSSSDSISYTLLVTPGANRIWIPLTFVACFQLAAWQKPRSGFNLLFQVWHWICVFVRVWVHQMCFSGYRKRNLHIFRWYFWPPLPWYAALSYLRNLRLDPMTRMPGLLKLRYCWWKKSCTTWHIYNLVNKRDKLPINWGRISSVNSSTRKMMLGGLL